MDIRRIFVSKRGGIGDVILATPILRALKNKYPESIITLLVLPNAREVVADLDYIDEIVIYDKKMVNTMKLLRQIWHYDLALLLDNSYRPALLAFLAQIPVRIGVKHKRASLLSHGLDEDPQLDTIYEPYNMSNLLTQSVGMDFANEDLVTLDISPTSTSDKKYIDDLLAKHGLQGKPYVAIAPFTAFSPKDWPLENYETLSTHIQDEYQLPVVLLGAPQDARRVTGISAVNLLGQTTFMQMAEIIRRATLLLGSCSGHIHAAAAVGTPSIGFYGPSALQRWAPPHNSFPISMELPCSPCWTKNLVCAEHHCMNRISVAKVVETLEQALASSCKGVRR